MLLTTLAHAESPKTRAQLYFILFVSSGLGMCGTLNSLVCNDRLNSQWRLRHSGVERVEYSLTYRSFASFNAPYNPVRFMYGKRTASIPFLILRLLILCASWSRKYGNYSQNWFTNYFVLSKNVGLARYPENRNRTCSHVGQSGAILPEFFVLLHILFCQENFLLKDIIKTFVLNSSLLPVPKHTKSIPPTNVLCPSNL